MGARRDGAGDLGEMGVHRRGVGEGQHQPGGHAALRADRAEEVGPFVAGVARRPRPGAAPRPDPGERALLADPRLVLEPDLERLAARRLGERRRYRLGEVFLKAVLGLGIGLRMARAHREPAVAERRQILADRPLVQLDPERAAIRRSQVLPPPAHHPVHRRVGAGLQPGHEFGHLLGIEPPRPRRRPPVREPGEPLRVVAVHPVPQRLPVHPAGLRRGLPVDALQHQRQRQHPPRRLRIPAPRRRRPQLRRRQLRPRDRNRCAIPASSCLEAQ